jgi:hypothetical protein
MISVGFLIELEVMRGSKSWFVILSAVKNPSRLRLGFTGHDDPTVLFADFGMTVFESLISLKALPRLPGVVQ